MRRIIVADPSASLGAVCDPASAGAIARPFDPSSPLGRGTCRSFALVAFEPLSNGGTGSANPNNSSRSTATLRRQRPPEGALRR